MIQTMFKSGGKISREEYLSYLLLQAIALAIWSGLVFGVSKLDRAAIMPLALLLIAGFVALMWIHYITIFKRVRDIFGKCYHPLWIILSLIPMVAIPLNLFLATAPSRKLEVS
jgi:uncharacterized membrane protein YhaH (DUF805 family)